MECQNCGKSIRKGTAYEQIYGSGYFIRGPEGETVDWEIEPYDDNDEPILLCKKCAISDSEI